MDSAAKDNVFDVTEETFQQKVVARSHKTTVLVDFWAPWCGPCRMLGPVLERLAQEPDSNFVLAKLNVDHAPALSQQFGVQGIPAVKAFRDGRVVDDFVGALPEPRVRDFIARVAPSAAARAIDQAADALAKHNWSNAEKQFRDLIGQNGSDAGARVGLAAALLAQGEGQEATTLLTDIPAGPHFSRAETLRPLADYLARLEGKAADEETTLLESRYRQAARWLREEDITRAMDALLVVLQEKKDYRKGEARQVLLALFDLLGNDDSRTAVYRQRLASILY